MAFHVGQRVVCVKGTSLPAHMRSEVRGNFPKLQKVYTVASIAVWNGREILRFAELDNRHIRFPGGIEAGFFSYRFRPLDEARLDQFRAHLAPTPKERVSA